MAAFVAWMVQSLASTIRTTITGAREETGTTLTDTTNSTSVARSRKPDSSKVRQRIKKPNEEPAFNTKLTTPIESILEETINEDLKTSASETSKGNSIKSKNKPSASVPKSTNSQQSGIKKKSKKDKPKNPEPSKEVKTTEKEQLEVFTEFVPVKDKRKAKSKGQFEKKDSQLGLKEVVAQSVKNRTDPSKPIVTEHFKKPIVPKTKFVNTVGNSHEFVFVSGLEEKLITIKQQQELKESKKVSSTISYASIVTNDFTEEVTKKTEESSLESLQKSDSSQLVAHDGIELLITGEFCDLKHNRDSSSIEVLSETTSDTQNTDYQNLHSTENTVLQEEKEEDFHEISNISDGFVKVFNVSENISVAEEALKYTEESSFNGFPPDINQKVPDIEGISPQLVFVCKEEAAEVFFKDFEAKAIVEEIDFKEESQPEKVSVILSEDQVFFVKEDTNFEVLSSPVEDEVKIVFEEANSSSEFLTQQVEVEEDSLLFESRHLTESTVQSGIGGSDTTIVDSLKGFIEQEKETSNESEDFVLKSKEKKTDSDTTEKNRVHSLDSKEEFFVHILKENGTDHHQQLNGSAIEEDLLKDFIVQEKETSDLNGYCVLKNIENKEDQSIKVETVATQVLHNNISETEENLIISEESKAEKNIDTSSQITEDIHIQTREKEDTDNTLYSTMSQVRILTLNDKEHQESTIYRIEKNWIIQFRLGPTLLGRKVNLYCNYPQENGGKLEEYDRCNYHLLSWCHDDGCKNADDTALFTQIQAELAGGFHYYFVYENGKNTERQGSGYFLVDPILKYGHGENLPLDCIQCQTVLAKGLGPFSTWEKKLQVAKESGYNMIHFTPLQELGASNSSYSLSEQLKLNPIFNEEENGGKPSFEDVEKLVCKLRKDWKISSICDIVLNHTANESEWLKTHPEVTYNCNNCPYMRPAYLLDAALHRFSMDVKKGLYEDRGIPAEVCSEEHLNAIRHHFKLSVLDQLKIYELFSVDTETLVREFLDLARKTAPVTKGNHPVTLEELTLLQDPEFRRLKTNVSMEIALKTYNVYRNDSFDEETRLRKCAEDFKRKLDYLNEKVLDEVNADLHAAMENVIAGIRYFRVQSDGPKFKEITANRPLVSRYFTDYGTPKNIKEHEDIMYSEHGTFLMAHNGWVMNSDPLKNFADPGSKIYIRRELIAWGDSVKLRYGDSPADCPFLWDHMRKYVELTAKIFDGVRLDNCHSTPLNVAEYLLDCARRVRPDLYVVAELFTNSDLTDNVFVNRLGITSLIREAMSAWDSHEEGRLVYRYGGVPVGSFYQPNIRPLVPTVAHALFMDLTHDNPSPVEKRCVFDMLPSTALVNMACCASGSNRGYDELVPHHIHVVDETRQYTEWTPDQSLAKSNARYVTKHSGIIAAKKAMNDLHFKLGKEGFNQVYVDQMDTDIVAVTRHNPETHESYILVAFTAFGHPDPNSDHHQRGIKPLRVEGVLDEIVFETSLSHINVKSGGSKFAKFEDFLQESKWINGLSEYQVSLKEHIQVEESDVFEKVTSESPNVTQVNFKHFKPGSAVVVKVSLPDDMKESVNRVRKLIKEQLSFNKNTELRQIIEKLKLSDLNRALYRCDQEERDEGYGFDVYNIPNFGPIVYAGLQGFMSLLANIRPNNDLGHPMCGNLRDGNWMLEYIWKRLKLDEGTKQLGQWIEENTKCFNTIPRYLVPCYFDVVVTGIYIQLLEQCYKLMSGFVAHGSTFVKALSLGSVQFAAYIKSADLPTLSPNIAPPKPPTRKNQNGEVVQACVTLSAGLPHFSVGYMRNWGRDTFIALRGLFILTGRYQEAREHILGYAACLRHGLIPNLLDGGRNSRFNCRDAVWWWLYCIKEYVQEAPNGVDIINDKVSRIFPTDDSPPQAPGTSADQTLAQVIQEALNVHFQGLAFRERNAGKQIDEHMTDRGFNNHIGVHPDTGFVFGGNEWNCGTWMDKMGSSDKAGNRGKPATPRDGSAIELIGLSKSVVTWLHRLHQSDKYPYNGVERKHKTGTVTRWTFREWSEKIQENFEKYFWVNAQPTPNEMQADLINKRGIYKDTFGATHAWCDYQLRCNFPIAMVAAPELFNPQHAWIALQNAEKHLLGPLGMKTLDASDWNYRGDYDNSDDSADASVAHGFNYHQGPEWVWPVGFFLRAKLLFAAQNGALKETVAATKVILSKHFVELQTSLWRGLPELTNSNGSYCRDSSRTQAWSMSCILEVLHDLQQIESRQIVVN